MKTALTAAAPTSSDRMGSWIRFAATTRVLRIAVPSKLKTYERAHKQVFGIGPGAGIRTYNAFAWGRHNQRSKRSAPLRALANLHRQRSVLFHVLVYVVSTQDRLGDCRWPLVSIVERGNFAL